MGGHYELFAEAADINLVPLQVEVVQRQNLVDMSILRIQMMVTSVAAADINPILQQLEVVTKPKQVITVI